MSNLYFIVISIFFGSSLLLGCTAVDFMGSQRYISNYIYDERWFLNPEYNDSDIPDGTELYGASGKKQKTKFFIRYYQGGTNIVIPYHHMWNFKHNGKSGRGQENNDLFYYEKNHDGNYVKSSRYVWDEDNKPKGISEDLELLPIQSCDSEWCLLYPSDRRGNTNYYIKKSILLDHL